MATSRVQVKTEILTTITLTEDEVMALDGIFGYGAEAFLKAFYREMGKVYVQPYEKGVRSLHEHMRGTLSPAISKIREIRRQFPQ